MKKVIYRCILVLFCFSSVSFGTGSKTDVKEIIEKIDRMYRSKTSIADVEMIVTTPNWKRKISLQFWTEGMDKTFIYIESPKKDKGITTLRIGEKMWNFFPKINKVMKVPPSMMMGSWMGSDFTNDDLVKESTLLDDYDYSLFTPENADKNYYYLKLTPKKMSPKKQVVSLWSKIELHVRKKDLIPVKELYFGDKNELARKLEFKDIKILGKRKIPTRMIMTPVSKKDHSTIIIYKSASFDVKLPKATFTLRNLQSPKKL